MDKQNKLTSFRVYLVVSTLNLQHSLKLLVIFKVAFWDDWPSFIWRRAVFCSTLSIWHHLASIIMQFHCFILGVPPYQICLYLKVSLQSLSCLKLKLETFHMALVQNLTQSSAFTLLPHFTNVTGWNKPWQYVHCAVQMTAHTELQLPLITVIIWYSID